MAAPDPNLRAAALNALQQGVPLTPDALAGVFRQVYGDAYLSAAHAAVDHLGGGAHLTGTVADTASSVDWDSWKPGYGAAADLVGAAADGAVPGLQALLDSAGVTIDGITGTTFDRMAAALADGLASGASVDTITAAIDAIIDDTARAGIIALTETARAIGVATMDTYKANGIEGKQWLVADDACPICEENEAQGVIPLDEEFSSGDDAPPAHPSCRCAIAGAGPAGEDTTDIEE